MLNTKLREVYVSPNIEIIEVLFEGGYQISVAKTTDAEDIAEGNQF